MKKRILFSFKIVSFIYQSSFEYMISKNFFFLNLHTKVLEGTISLIYIYIREKRDIISWTYNFLKKNFKNNNLGEIVSRRNDFLKKKKN